MTPSRPTISPAAMAKSAVKFGNHDKPRGQRVLLYGTGGVGKTTLACQFEGKSAIIDADESLYVLRASLADSGTAVPVPVEGVTDWLTLRAALQSPGWDKIDNVILDSVTKIEEWCLAHTLATVKHEKGHKVQSLDDYGWGSGPGHLFGQFNQLIGDMDNHVRAGRSVILIAHDCTSTVPNPAGEDWIRFEPRLQNPKSGQNSIRLRLKEWADHVLFLGYDIAVKDKKAAGSGTRTLYASEMPHCMAKSRTYQGAIDMAQGANPWPMIIK